MQGKWSGKLDWKTPTAIALILAGTIGVQAATTAIGQAGQVFNVKLLTLAVGESAVFMNDDGVRHNIRIIDESDQMTDVGIQQPGENLSYTFTKAGKFRVRCGIHPGMKLTVIAR